MSAVFGSKTVKIRSPRNCDGCSDHYERGARLIVTKGINDGQFWSIYLCPICEAFTKQPSFWFDHQDGFEPGDFREDCKYEAFKEDFLKNFNKVRNLKPVLV